MIPIQVIQNVDLVKGKRTLVRTILLYLQGSQPEANATARIYLDGQFQNQITQNITHGTNTIDVFFTNTDIEGQNITITSQVESTLPGFSTTNVTEVVDIVEAYDLNLVFVKLDGDEPSASVEEIKHNL